MSTTEEQRIPVTLRRSLEIGLRIAPGIAAAVPTAKALAARLDEIATPVRIAGIGRDGTRIHITLAITLGDIDEIKVGGPGPRAAIAGLQILIDDLAGHDPAFVLLPDRSSPEAILAAEVMRRVRSAPVDSPIVGAVAHLVDAA